MKQFAPLVITLAVVCFVSCTQQKNQTELMVKGLLAPVEIIRDTMGVNHIYAKNEHDLFFAQGYSAAKDRLFQFEIWRRQATGTVSEILGAREVKRDIGARLFKFRGDLKKEFNHYHPHGEAIINAFTEGINAYISETENDPKLLPLEFRLLGLRPQRWSPEVVISRHQGLMSNLTDEITLGRAVSVMGAEKVKQLRAFQPGEPDIRLDPKLKNVNFHDSVTELYSHFKRSLRFQPKDLIASANTNEELYKRLTLQDEQNYLQVMASEKQNIGSNNWIVSGSHSASGFPMLANDPHRSITAPSLRYLVHLNAPGWNVVGAGEPMVPGVSIGHNEDGAWGLTVFAIDAEDLYVYDLNPENRNQYKYQGQWETFTILNDTIHVKDSMDVLIEHKFTRHGPVTYLDINSNIAFGVRCAWLETGGAPYLSSLRIDQAKTWEEFREGCSYSNMPGENMIWADREGNIGWQAVGIAPVRKNWSGLVPVPGDGRYEWSSYLPIKSLPSVFNPGKGFLATANENNVPLNYEHRNAVAWLWADPFRVNRINEVLDNEKKHSLDEMMALQFDYHSLPARNFVPLLKDLQTDDPKVETARQKLLQWDYVLDKNSVTAGIYVAWEKKITAKFLSKMVPEEGKKIIKSIPLSKVIMWVTTADPMFGKDPVMARNTFLISCLSDALADLENKLGADQSKWQYGQPSYHHVLIKHPLSNAVDEKVRKKLELGPLPRGGNATTTGVTTNNDNQNSGASFRMVADTQDWDKTMFTNTPGQSGNPESLFYGNLFELWANDRHFPVYFSRTMVEKSAYEKIILKPEKKQDRTMAPKE